MATRLYKEARELWPFLAGTLLLIEVPFLIWGARVGDFGLSALEFGCMLLAASTFGQEFQHRTATLLLAQPIARRRMWEAKMLVLGAALALSTPVLWWNLRKFAVGYRPDITALILIPLCAFCGGPWLTLRLRSGVAGAVGALALPGGLLAIVALVFERWWPDASDKLISQVMVGCLVVYCPVAYWLGYATFQRYEAIEGRGRELMLPHRFEAWAGQALGGLAGRFSSPVAALAKKELRLQQFAFVAAGLFVLASILGAALYQRHSHDWAGAVLAITFALYLPLLPILIGGISTAEERGWGFSEWHLTLPPSARQQWIVKSAVTLLLSLALGLVLPGLLVILGEVFTTGLDPHDVHEVWDALPCIVLGQLIVTTLAAYAGTFSRSTLLAMLVALGMLAGFGWVYEWEIKELVRVMQQISRAGGLQGVAVEAIIWGMIPGGMLLLLMMLQGFAYGSFKRGGLSLARFVAQFAALLAVAVLYGLLMIVCLVI